MHMCRGPATIEINTAGAFQTLVISGNNFLGVNRIQFEDNASNAFGNLNITGLAPQLGTIPVGPGQIIFSQMRNLSRSLVEYLI